MALRPKVQHPSGLPVAGITVGRLPRPAIPAVIAGGNRRRSGLNGGAAPVSEYPALLWHRHLYALAGRPDLDPALCDPGLELAPAADKPASPYDPEARFRHRGRASWAGYWIWDR